MTPEKVFDAYLVLQYQRGDKKALGLLVKRHHYGFCKHAHWYIKDIDGSKDIVQESWKVIMKKLIMLRDPNCFSSWAMKIVTRKSLDHLKKQKKIGEHLNNHDIGTGAYEKEEENPVLSKLKKAIRELPKNQQVVLRLFYTQEYTLMEIADILEISIGTVKSRLYHAREKLKTILKT